MSAEPAVYFVQLNHIQADIGCRDMVTVEQLQGVIAVRKIHEERLQVKTFGLFISDDKSLQR